MFLPVRLRQNQVLTERKVVELVSATLIDLSASQLGQAVTKNPGYLKLRRIRAAQNIAKTVRDVFSSAAQELFLSVRMMMMMTEDVVSSRWRRPKTEFT